MQTLHTDPNLVILCQINSHKFQLCLIQYISLLFLFSFLSRYSKTFLPKHMCVCIHAAPLYIFLLFDTWKFSIHGFSWWWPYNHLNHSCGISEHLKCSRQGSLHISERKAATNTELLEKGQILMEKYKCYLRIVLHLYIKNVCT